MRRRHVRFHWAQRGVKGDAVLVATAVSDPRAG